MRKIIIIGNWKLNKNRQETKVFVETVERSLANDLVSMNYDFGIAPSFTLLETAKSVSKNLIIAAQNSFYENKGAYTGEVSPLQLMDLGINWTILGHSERRQLLLETDEVINKKLLKASSTGLKVILCVGETANDYQKNETDRVLNHQVSRALKEVNSDYVEKMVIAYEPVWAIGTGQSANPEIAQKACQVIRTQVKKIYGPETAKKVRIQYGGSVTSDNIQDYLRQEDIDGALIGGASLSPQSFIEIIQKVKEVK